MDYAEAREAFFQPRDGADTPDDATPGRRLRHAIEPIATIHFWSEPSSVAYAGIGLDFLGGYVGSRACVLGEASGAVVAAAFGVFEPTMIASIWDATLGSAPVAQLRSTREKGAISALQAVSADAPATNDVSAAATALRRGIEAADPTGRALFAGSAGLGWPGEPMGDLWHACSTLREYRGDSHLGACISHGLTGLQANLLTELQVGWEPQSYAATRGWSAEAMDAATAELGARGLVEGGRLTEKGAGIREHIETATEAQVAPVLAAIGDDLDAVIETTSALSNSIVEHGWFPPDPFKRASG